MGPPNSSPERSDPAENAPSRLERSFDVLVALVLITLGAPVFLFVALVVFLADGRPILYRGTRLGRNLEPFKMLKFRTLVQDASERVGSGLLNHRHQALLRYGNFLRDTRLDELPQLFNILKGDMRFFGPRPVRPEVYDAMCSRIPGYEARFQVAPGLIGFSQVFTPHGAPKRLRSRIDNRVLFSGLGWSNQIGLLAFTVYSVVKEVLRRVVRFVYYSWMIKVRRKFRQRRTTRRVRHESAYVALAGGAGDTNHASDEQRRFALVDINDEAFSIRTEEKLDTDRVPIELAVDLNREPASRRVKVARCEASLSQVRFHPEGHEYVFSYEPLSDNSRYVVDQYLLQKSLARLRRRRVGAR